MMSFSSLEIVYNLPGVSEAVTIWREDLANIFIGDIELRNDASLRAHNPGVDLPQKKIHTIARRSGSGSTEVFTSALSAFSDVWKQKYNKFKSPDLLQPEGPSQTWPPKGPKFFAAGGSGITDCLYPSIGDDRIV